MPDETPEQRKQRLEREDAARHIRATFPPYRDPDVIPDLRDAS